MSSAQTRQSATRTEATFESGIYELLGDKELEAKPWNLTWWKTLPSSHFEYLLSVVVLESRAVLIPLYFRAAWPPDVILPTTAGGPFNVP